jgi:hypothetical protein
MFLKALMTEWGAEAAVGIPAAREIEATFAMVV